MSEIELILEIPATEDGALEYPDNDAIRWSTGIGHVQGLDGHEALQLGVLVGAATVRILRSWLIARSERLKQTHVVWEGQSYQGYTPREIERLVRLLEERTGGEGDGGQGG